LIGASSGIGRGIAERSIAAGARVILAARRAETLKEIVAEAGGGHDIVADLRDEISCERLGQEVAKYGAPVDLVFISAGVAPLRRLDRTSAQDWRDALATNLIGIHRVITSLLDHLAPDALVAAVSSEAATNPRSHLGAYGASKAALEHTFAQWQEEHRGLRFTTVSLGATVPTEFGRNFDSEEILDAFNAWTAAGLNASRFMSTPEVCDVLFATLSNLLRAPSVGMPRIELRSPAPPETDKDAALKNADSDAQRLA
jgi:NAD(P)-dependent dehydrogenase (short-subunit alcohol dehydrogenase family)